MYEVTVAILIVIAFTAALFESSITGILLSIAMLAIFVKVFWEEPS